LAEECCEIFGELPARSVSGSKDLKDDGEAISEEDIEAMEEENGNNEMRAEDKKFDDFAPDEVRKSNDRP
jgi:hypothetical protein